MTAAQRLLDRLEGVKDTGAGRWRALCPAHEDRNPSLGIAEKDDGTVLVTCRAGCPTGDVLAAVDLGLRDLFEPEERERRPNGRRPATPPSTQAARQPAPRPAEPLPTASELAEFHRQLLAHPGVLTRLLAVHGWSRATIEHFGLGFDGERVVIPVRGADGSLSTVLRYKAGAEPKMLAAPGHRRDLFPPPEAVEEDEVWLVEGEPDALSAHEMGLRAVGIPGVEYAKRTHEWAHRFAGRRVVVCFDADPQGRDAAQKAGEALLPFAAEVRVLDIGALDSEPDEGDGADYRDQPRDRGYDVGDLLSEYVSGKNGSGRGRASALLKDVAASTPPLAPATDGAPGDGADLLGEEPQEAAADAPSAFGFVSSPKRSERDERKVDLPFASLKEAIASAPTEPEWAWDGYLAPGALTLLAGRPKVGESTLVFALLEALLKGQPFLGGATRPSGVLLLSEERQGTLAEKARRFGLGGSIDLLMRHEAAGVEWSEVVRQAVERCHERGLGILVVDTWDKWTGLRGDNEKSAGYTLEALEPLTQAAGEGLAVLIVAHQRKALGSYGEAVRGSNALTGGVDVVVELERPSADLGSEGTARVLHAVSRYAGTPEEQAAKLEGDRYIACGSVGALRGAKERDRLLDALEHGGSMTADALSEETGMAKATVHKRLRELAEESVLVRYGAGKRGDPYRWEFVSSRSDSLGDETKVENSAGALGGLIEGNGGVREAVGRAKVVDDLSNFGPEQPLPAADALRAPPCRCEKPLTDTEGSCLRCGRESA
jgi:hypothetical protein